MSKHYIEERNLSVAWGRALRVAISNGGEISPLLVVVTGFDDEGNFQEELAIRAGLDAALAKVGKQTVRTVANTVFPRSLWNPARPRKSLFARYEKLIPRLHSASRKNNRGTYFERMIRGGPPGKENQLEFALTTYLARPRVRRSVLQVGVFNPRRDHSAAALMGFPCLQHVTFASSASGLVVNAFYAMHYLVERAYGNYVGLCELGQFVAHELDMPLAKVACVAGIAKVDVPKRKLGTVLTKIDAVIGPTAAEG